MKGFRRITWLLCVIPLLLLAACSGEKPTATPTVDTAPVLTQIAQTALAYQTQTMQAQPTATNTPLPPTTPEATHTPLITDTPQPDAASATPQASNTPKATLSASCDNMAYVADVTIPDGYQAAPGEYMQKTWKVKNLGPCKWTTGYKIVFGYGGDKTEWKSSSPGYVPNEVASGQTVDLTVSLKAPTTKGEYGAYFRMVNDKGVPFGPWITIYIRVP
jgi:hypothetical protein